MASGMKLYQYIGLAGVDKHETKRAQRLDKLFHYCQMPLVIWLALQWHYEVLHQFTSEESYFANFMVWIFFVVNVIVLWATVRNKIRYLMTNWMYCIFIICGLAFVFQIAIFTTVLSHYRLMLIGCLLLPWVDACFDSMSDNRLGTTLVTALIIILLAGILIAGIDPNIHTFTDGIWWAWVTVSTVGYGDIVPVSGIGRIFSAGLILMGLALFSAFTANFSAFFFKKEVKKVKKETLYILQILEDLQKVREEEHDILAMLQDIQKRLKRLEERGK